MGAQVLKRAAEEEIRQVLGDGALRGEDFRRAILALGHRHAIEPFRACLRLLLRAEASEEDARVVFDTIEVHRAFLAARLGRDPGFLVAAIDSIPQVGGPERLPALGALPGEGSGSGAAYARPDQQPIDDTLRLEVRRAERSGRPLAVLLLSPGAPEVPSEAIMSLAIPALRDALRDTDQLARILPEGLVAILPATGGTQALKAAERLRGRLGAVTGIAWDAGVAASPDLPLEAAALARGVREALRSASASEGPGAVTSRPERRFHPRRRAGDALECVIRRGADESVIRIEDLSLGGALLEAGERYDQGCEVELALRQTSARPREARVSSRVLRVDDGPRGVRNAFRTAVCFAAGPEERHGIAGLLADLRSADEPSSDRA